MNPTYVLVPNLQPAAVILHEKGEGAKICMGTTTFLPGLRIGRVLDLARLGTYDYFGEMSLLTGEARSANVVALTECQILEVGKNSLEPLFEQRPELTEEIAAIMAERKLKSELMTAETKKLSVGDRLRDYSKAFAKSIRSFFAK